jgi:hypothetical protein
MKKKIICGVLALAVLLIGGCGSKKFDGYSGGAPMEKSAAYEGERNNTAANMDMATTTEDSALAVKEESKTVQSSTSQKKIIRTGEIRIQVDDLKKTSTEITNKVNAIGGYVESESLSENYSNSRLRVPADKLQAFTEYVENTFEVQGKDFSSEDITNAYVDNEARLNNMKAEEKQYLEIMKKVETVEDTLKVQNELFRVRGEIESLEARQKLWDREVGFSSVTIIASKKQLAIESKLKSLSASEFGKSIGKGFVNSTTALILFLQNLAIFIISNIIILAILAAAAFFGYKKVIKGKDKEEKVNEEETKKN